MSAKGSAVATPSLDELRAEAMAWGRKPRRWGWWYVTDHMVRTMRAYGWTIVVGALGQPLLYLFGLVLGLASIVQADIPIGGGASVPYLVYVAPALLMSAAIAIASEEYSYPVMQGFKWRRHYYGFNASPIASPQIATGVALAPAARMAVAIVPYYVLLVVFGTVSAPNVGWLSMVVALLVGLAFGMPMLAYAASLRDDTGQFALVQRFIFTPMFLFSGTFYPLSNLDWWLAWIGWISPLWHASELGRALTFSQQIPPWLVAVHLGYLLVFSIGGYLIARRVFTRRLAE